MYILFRSLLLLSNLFIIINCSEKTIYSGKILNNEVFDYINLKNKDEIINTIGQPNYIDIIENKYYYFSERTKTKNFFDQKITNRKIIVFNFNKDETIKSFSQYDLDDQRNIEYVKDKTPNEIIKRGLIEKLFGGVGKNVPIDSQ